MADRDRKKALFRAKLNEKQQKTRIDSPLVRYNENGKPICRVCDVVLKSDSDWIAHQASRKHHEAINNLKASASRKITVNETDKEISKLQKDEYSKSKDDKPRMLPNVQNSRQSSMLPTNFFDHGVKKQKVVSPELQQEDASVSAVPPNSVRSSQHEIRPARVAEDFSAASENKQSKGELPEGFFDNKEADQRARGIEPVKPDVKDEYKEFEKLIQEDLAEVDNRLEEEEVDAAEQIEEEEIIEQRTYRNRVEELKRKKMELVASSKEKKNFEVSESKTEQANTSSEDEDDESFAVDWRAQHL
ncbi:unnamed protein product [Amaranthus hypochondriacus]